MKAIMALSTQPYKGARDFYPEDKRLQKQLFKTMRKVVERFGYEEYDAPLIEPLELYAAKTGDEIVNEQTYSFTDRGGRQVAIRPEMTPTVSRMVAAKRQELPYPLRWYSIPVNWRYERPQRGRLREFWQLNVDLFGVGDLSAEQEIIQVADEVMQAYGAKRSQYSIRLNSRKLTDSFLLEYLRLDQVQAHTFSKLIDKMHKITHAEFVAQTDALLTPSQRESGIGDHLLEVLKAEELQELPEKLQRHPSVLELKQLMDLLQKANIKNVIFDFTLMRGFDYYTDIVFEVFDTNPENNRSMFGGGRYDGLVGLFGAEPVPTVGFAMGDVTLTNFLETHDLMPRLRPETDACVVLIGDVYEYTLPMLADLRQMGVNVAVDLTGRKPASQIKSAVKKGVPYAIFVGEKELADERYTLKNLDTGKEERHSLQRIVAIVRDYRR